MNEIQVFFVFVVMPTEIQFITEPGLERRVVTRMRVDLTSLFYVMRAIGSHFDHECLREVVHDKGMRLTHFKIGREIEDFRDESIETYNYLAEIEVDGAGNEFVRDGIRLPIRFSTSTSMTRLRDVLGSHACVKNLRLRTGRQQDAWSFLDELKGI